MILFETFRDLWRLLDRAGRVRAAGLVVLLALSGALEITGMFFLFGYIAVLGGADHGGQLAIVTDLYQAVAGSYAGAQFAIAAGLVLVGIFAIKNALWLLSSFALLRFVMKRYEKVATALFDGYQDMPLELLRQRGTLEPAQVLNSVLMVFRSAFRPLLLAAADIAIVLAMLAALLLVIDPGLVLGSGLILGITAAAFLAVTRRISTSLGERVRKAQIALSTVMNEALGGMLEVRLAGRQDVMRGRFGE
ncbi:MAG TPA: hypothetical protein VLA37_03675, partial [Sphingomonadaceae bacterium]|nr:hypothetical protein [Sphingomonadaceae bacterium]